MMMNGGIERTDEDRSGSFEAAQAGLARVRERLEAAARGEATPDDVQASLQGYLDAHRQTLKDAAAAVAEEVRRQALTELYKWRAQIVAQQRQAAERSGAATG